MSNTAGRTPPESEPYHWASALDREDLTLSDLAAAVDELGIPDKLRSEDRRW